MQFLDWLALHQFRAPGSLPLVAKEYRSSTSIETGELVRESVTSFQHEGSWDSSLHIRSDGSQVSLSGNPSAFDRMDNLFGYSSMNQALTAVNAELSLYGLPAFDSERTNEEIAAECRWSPAGAPRPNRSGSLGSFVSTNGRMAAKSQTLIQDERARITRVDLTENFATDDPLMFLRHISTYQHHGKVGNLWPNGQTVDWGGSRRVYQKYYNKAHDIQRKIKELTKHLNGPNYELLEKHIAYLEKLLVWCQENGIVRRETSFKSTEIIDRKLTHIENWDYSTMTNIIRPYQFHQKIKIEQTTFESIKETLQNEGISERLARQAELIHCAWIQGRDYKALCGTPRNFRRYRKMLFLVGVDIANPCDISRITMRVHKTECKPIDPPSWYQMPQLKIAA